jgi:hypothetical protein
MFFDVQELDLLVESVSYCGSYGVVALSVVAVYLNVYVVEHYFFILQVLLNQPFLTHT